MPARNNSYPQKSIRHPLCGQPRKEAPEQGRTGVLLNAENHQTIDFMISVNPAYQIMYIRIKRIHPGLLRRARRTAEKFHDADNFAMEVLSGNQDK